MKKPSNNILLRIIFEFRNLRNTSFKYQLQKISFIEACRIIFYENYDFEKADQLYINLVVKNLIEIGILHAEPIIYSKYYFETLIYHDIFLKTSDNSVFCRGTSTDKSTAYAKAIGEVFERTSLKYNYDKNVIAESENKLSILNKNFVSFNKFPKPTFEQFEKFPNFRISINDIFSWVNTRKYKDNQEVLIQAQTIFYNNFVNFPNEKNIIQQTTHGAGAGYSAENAFFSGLFEIGNRHFFLKSWYMNTKNNFVDLNSIPPNTSLRLKIDNFKKQNFNISFFDYSNESKVPSVICFIEKYGSYSVGGSMNLKLLGAMERALDEAFSTHLWSVQITMKGGNNLNQFKIDNIKDSFSDSKMGDSYYRVLLFNDLYHNQKNFNIKNIIGDSINYSEIYDKKDFDSAYKEIEKYFKDIYYYQVKNEYLSNYNYFATRVIVPNSYFFALDEIYSRPILNNILPLNKKINPFP